MKTSLITTLLLISSFSINAMTPGEIEAMEEEAQMMAAYEAKQEADQIANMTITEKYEFYKETTKVTKERITLILKQLKEFGQRPALVEVSKKVNLLTKMTTDEKAEYLGVPRNKAYKNYRSLVKRLQELNSESSIFMDMLKEARKVRNDEVVKLKEYREAKNVEHYNILVAKRTTPQKQFKYVEHPANVANKSKALPANKSTTPKWVVVQNEPVKIGSPVGEEAYLYYRTLYNNALDCKDDNYAMTINCRVFAKKYEFRKTRNHFMRRWNATSSLANAPAIEEFNRMQNVILDIYRRAR